MTNDVDEIAVERACKGDRSITLNRAEAAEAFRLLDKRGLSANEIADVLGVSRRTVHGWRDGRSTPITRPGAVMDNTREKITAALRSDSAAIRRAATKANQALASLDTLLADWDAQQAARERVAELEAALAEAKAVLQKKKPAGSSRPGEHKQARAWARQQGIPVPDIGKVPGELLERWRAATAA